MNIVIAMDSLKGSLTSLEAGNAAAEGVRRVYPMADIQVRPLADGGEGTVAALTQGMGGELHTVPVLGPLGEKVDAVYGILPDERTAMIEMSAAAGITLVPAGKRNPLHTTTYGVGQIIRDAAGRGCRSFLVGIGGSATNDGGIGMLQALGYDLLDGSGHAVPFGAEGLAGIQRISAQNVLPELRECTFRIACDVTNPLCGSQGSSAVYGPQKGAAPDMVEKMDRWLARFAELTRTLRPEADPDVPGSGAAGGLGFAFLNYTNAVLESGVKIVLEKTRLAEYIAGADLVITGEGRLDAQTVMGKAPAGAARIAKEYGKPVIAFGGCVSEDARVCNEYGIDAYFPIIRQAMSLKKAMEPHTACQNMAGAVEQVLRAMRAGSQFSSCFLT